VCARSIIGKTHTDAPDFDVADLKARVALDSQAAEIQAVLRGHNVRRALVRRDKRRDKQHLIQFQDLAAPVKQGKMPLVNRVECPAEYADPHAVLSLFAS
jgi:hypothetical protein